MAPPALSPLAVAGLAALAILAFAGNSLLTRAALAGDLIGPAAFANIRLISGALALVAFSLAARRDWRPVRSDASGALALAVYAVAFSFAYVRLDAASGALILFAAVSATVTAASFRSGVTARELGGLTLAFAGLVWLLAPGARPAAPGPSALMILAGIAWGGYTLIGRAGGEPIARTTRNFAIAAILALPFLLIGGDEPLTAAGLALAVICGVITSAAGYAVWYACLPRLPVIASGSVQLATPAVAALGGVVLLAEPMSLRLAGASALILTGVGMTLLRH